jgi:hypothetical protein
MKTPLQLLDEIRIPTSCSASWDEMDGDDRVRHCSRCKTQVYNLSALTASDAVALLREKQDNLCIQLFRREDGTILTADSPRGAARRLRRTVKRLCSLAASVAAFFLLFGCDSRKKGIDWNVVESEKKQMPMPGKPPPPPGGW